MSKTSWFAVAFVAFIGLNGLSSGATPVQAQARQTPARSEKQRYKANATKAVSVTRTVLERQGYTVVRVERVGSTRVVYYRRGNNGRGKGKGPLQKLVIRTVRDRVVFEDTAPEIMVDIDVKLRL